MKRTETKSRFKGSGSSLPLVGVFLAIVPSLVTGQTNNWPVPDKFNPNANGFVHALAIQGDGRLLVGGEFTAMAGQNRNRLARFNADGSLDSAFNPNVNGSVYTLAVQPGGKLLAGGWFTSLGGWPRNRVARLNADGSVDLNFNPNANGIVYCLAIQSDGKVLAGGNFTSIAGQGRNRIARLNNDGGIDAEFDPDANGYVYSIGMQADGKILAGGSFGSLDGRSRTGMARLNPDGSLDEAFNPNINNAVFCLAVQADGKVLAGGNFTLIGGQPRSFLARLNADGSLDDTFNPAVDNVVFSLAIQTDGKVLAGGNFASIDAVPRPGIARLNPDGTLDAGFNPNPDGYVYALALDAGGRTLVGGNFTTIAGEERNFLARLNATEPAVQNLGWDGSTIDWERGGTSPEVWRTTFEITTNHADWMPLGVGERTTAGWQLAGLSLPVNLVLRARGFTVGGYGNASSWFVETLLGPPALAAHPEGGTYPAGSTTSLMVVTTGSEPMHYRWRRNGVEIEDGAGIQGSDSATLTLRDLLAVMAGDYDVVVSNSYGTATSQVARLSVLDPCIFSQPVSRNANAGQSITFEVLAGGTEPLSHQWYRNGQMEVGATAPQIDLINVTAADEGGYSCVITNAHGSVTSLTAMLTVTVAALPDPFNPSANDWVRCLAVQPDNKVLAAGDFTLIAGQPRNRIARLDADGSLDSSFNADANDQVLSMSLQTDGKVLVGGLFNQVNGQPRVGIARLHPDGALDLAFNPNANGGVRPMALQADGKILVGGMFTAMGGQSRNRIARLNVNGSLDGTFNPNANNRVLSLAAQPDGKVLAAGDFTAIGGQTRNHVARLNSDGSLDIAFNPNADGRVNTLAVQADGRILLGGDFTRIGGQPRNRMARINPDGTLDDSFNPGADELVYSFVVQADGRILVGGYFTLLGGQPRNRIARLYADGSLDGSFNPGANDWIQALAIQADGQVLAGGLFTAIGGQSRGRLARIHATELATQSLERDGETVVWWRTGTSPEIWHTTFEATTNGVDWTFLDAGQRIPGGWRITNVSLAEESVLRARGHTVGGLGNGSSWYVETVAGPPLIVRQPQPTFQITKPTLRLVYEVEVIGSAPLAYQWQVCQGPATNEVPGATSATLVVNNPEEYGSCQYRVMVSNVFGAAVSAPVTLRVIPRPELASQSRDAMDGTWVWSFFAETGAVYTVQATPALSPPAWEDIQTYTGDDSHVTVTNLIEAASNQFFRITME